MKFAKKERKYLRTNDAKDSMIGYSLIHGGTLGIKMELWAYAIGSLSLNYFPCVKPLDIFVGYNNVSLLFFSKKIGGTNLSCVDP